MKFLKKQNLSITLCCLLTTMTMVSSCTNDDWKDEITRVETSATGVVLLSAPIKVVKGGAVEITFRINPSDAPLKLEDVQLDCSKSEVYKLVQDEKSVTSRASYVQPSSNFELISLEPAKNAQDEALEGQWVLRAKAVAEGNVFVDARLHVVVNQTTYEGKQHQISSDGFDLTIVPTVEEGTDVWYCKNHTYIISNQITPSYISIDENKYQSEEGHVRTYSLENYLADAVFVPEEEAKGMFLQRTDSIKEYGFVTLYPVTAEAWKPMEEEEPKWVNAKGTLVLTDIFGAEYQKPVELAYTNFGEVMFPCPSPLEMDKEYVYDLTDYLTKAGFDYDAMEQYKRISIVGMPYSSGPSTPFDLFFAGDDDDYSKFTMTFFDDEDFHLTVIQTVSLVISNKKLVTATPLAFNVKMARNDVWPSPDPAK